MAYRLQLTFEDADSFRAEFERNVAMGGAFIPTGDPLELRSFVEVVFELLFCNESVALEAEVVHLVPPERALSPGDVGVAVSFRKPAMELREMFVTYLEEEAAELPGAAAGLDDSAAADHDTSADLPVKKPQVPTHHPPETRFEVAPAGSGFPGCSDLEASVLELAGAGFELARILEIIPEEPADVHRAIAKLLERDALKICGRH